MAIEEQLEFDFSTIEFNDYNKEITPFTEQDLKVIREFATDTFKGEIIDDIDDND